MEPGGEHSFLRPGVSRKTLKQLRRGHWNTDDQLDLHGFTRDEALRELDEFLDTCSMRGFRCVQIIHGKGLNSKNREPVLKTLVWSRLKQHSYVLAFCQAGPADGGSGAVIVLFKSFVTKRSR
jgi:DNA-nicking Smr family endonuclease